MYTKEVFMKEVFHSLAEPTVLLFHKKCAPRAMDSRSFLY